MKSEVEREGNRDASEKHIKNVDDGKIHSSKDEIDHISNLVENYKNRWDETLFQLSL